MRFTFHAHKNKTFAALQRVSEEKIALTVLAVLVVSNYFLPIGFFPLFDLNEGVFAEATREMLERHDWLVPTLNGHLRPDKPILLYWLQMVSVKLFGLNEFAIRLPSAIATTIWATALYRFVRRFVGAKEAFWSVFFMLASLHITIMGKAAMAEALLNLFIALSMFALYRYLQTAQRRHLYMLYSFTALGFLTKGPIAVFIPFAVGTLYLLGQKDFKRWLSLLDPKGIGLFVLLVAPWFVAITFKDGGAFVKSFFLTHNIERFTHPMERHGGGVWYYIPILLIGLLPFTTIFAQTISLFFRKWRSLDRLDRFLWIWFWVVFIFFTLSRTKQAHYIIYGYTPLFILMARTFIHRDKRCEKWLLLPIGLFFSLFLILPLVLTSIEPMIHKEATRLIIQTLLPAFGWSYYLLLLLGLSLLITNFERPKRLILASFLMIFFINFQAIPIYARLYQYPLLHMAHYVSTHRMGPVDLTMRKFSFSFYTKQPIRRRVPRPGEIAIVKRVDLPKYPGAKVIEAEGLLALIRR